MYFELAYPLIRYAVVERDFKIWQNPTYSLMHEIKIKSQNDKNKTKQKHSETHIYAKANQARIGSPYILSIDSIFKK